MMSALFTALREGGMDDALQHLAATQRERDEARQRVAQLERRVTDLRANDGETSAPRKFKLEGEGNSFRGHAQQDAPASG